jgi:hypothetical protein
MRRIIFAVISVIICTFLLFSCDASQTTTDDETYLNMLRYNWDGYGISTKKIEPCDLGNAIIDHLSTLQETGNDIPKISNGKLDEPVGELPADRGTVWLDCGNVGLFRLNPEMTEICKVKTHLGKGKELQMNDDLKELLRQAWYYYPNNCWSGSYENGEISLNHIYESESAVEYVEIRSVEIENAPHSQNNKITLIIRSKENKTANIRCKSYQSSDNLGSTESKEIELIEGGETSVDFVFAGFYNSPYFLSITIDNTRIDFEIDPR